MALPLYLAMTCAEFTSAAALPPKIAWMACHFSPYGTGLSNLPDAMPENSLIILNDRIPIHGHQPEQILAQLNACVKKQNARGVLLDLQRPGAAETQMLAEVLVRELPCPVGVAEPYAADLDCPIFLPPAPLDVPLSDYLAPWQGREIWLEAALDCEEITVTSTGASRAHGFAPPELQHLDPALHCRYAITLAQNHAKFTLCRTADTFPALLEEAQALSVTMAVGLYQEFRAASGR